MEFVLYAIITVVAIFFWQSDSKEIRQWRKKRSYRELSAKDIRREYDA